MNEIKTPLQAVIDIGTNTIKCLVVRWQIGGDWKILSDTTYPTRLGEGLMNSGSLSSLAIARNVAVIKGIVEALRVRDCNSITVVGTMALRSASNAESFIEQVHDACNIEIQILSGEQESRLSYLAAMRGFHYADIPVGVIDIGGGSTEIVVGSLDSIVWSKSFPVGAVHLTEHFLRKDPVEDFECDALEAALEVEFAELSSIAQLDKLIGIGGSICTIASVSMLLPAYDRERIHGFEISRVELERQYKMYRTLSVEERKTIPGMDIDRADIIFAGTCIVLAILHLFGVNSVVASDRGLRHALLMNKSSM